MTGIQELRIADIRTDGGTQPRAQLDMMTILEYTEAMQSGSAFPPVTVYYDGDAYWLADGFHRLHAAQEAGRDTISADVKQGTLRDAVLYSVGANASHGLRRTNADKRRAVETLLSDNEWRQWSDREIARRAAVDATFVGRVRRETVSTVDGLQSGVRKGADGRTINTANIGKHSEPEPPAYEPVAAWPTMDVGTATPGPASEAETVTVERDELDRLHNIEQWAKYEGGYYGENESYGEWGSTHEDEWNDARSGATPLSAYIPKAPPASVPRDALPVTPQQWEHRLEEIERETPEIQALPVVHFISALHAINHISDTHVAAWLATATPDELRDGVDIFQRIEQFAARMQDEIRGHRSGGLRLVNN